MCQSGAVLINTPRMDIVCHSWRSSEQETLTLVFSTLAVQLLLPNVHNLTVKVSNHVKRHSLFILCLYIQQGFSKLIVITIQFFIMLRVADWVSSLNIRLHTFILYFSHFFIPILQCFKCHWPEGKSQHLNQSPTKTHAHQHTSSLPLFPPLLLPSYFHCVSGKVGKWWCHTGEKQPNSLSFISVAMIGRSWWRAVSLRLWWTLGSFMG